MYIELSRTYFLLLGLGFMCAKKLIICGYNGVENMQKYAL